MKSDVKSGWRLLRFLLLLACAGYGLFSDDTWVSSISLERVSSAKWFSDDTQTELADKRIVSEQPPEISSSRPQLSSAGLRKNLLSSWPTNATNHDPSQRPITSARI